MTPSAKVSIGSNVVALAALVPAYLGHRYPMPFSYNTHKALHILGVILLVGNMVVGPLWVILAWRSHNPKLLAWASRTLALADIAFTVPGAQLALWNGLAMAGIHGGVRAQAWLHQAVLLLFGIMVLSPTAILYYQERFIALAEAEAPEEEFTRAFLRWSFWGTLVFVPFGLVFYMMVVRRGVW
ncbi:MAG: DUF2269 family protein [Deltaproteobacteria bacterium]|nr:DUF2269 family protein [Deltaproteobacteria bacterium]